MFFAKPARSFFFSASIALSIAGGGTAQPTDTIPPLPPAGLTANIASCGEVDLSWNATTDNTGGSGLKAYTINRYDAAGVNTPISIGATRMTFSDTNWVKSSSTMTYTVTAMDNAGNVSLASNSVTVTTPACPMSASEQIIDSADHDAFGKTIATYGSRTALIYQKKNAQLKYDTWLYVRDEDTGLRSQLLLHPFPGYFQVETDYVLTSATELWTLSYDMSNGGRVLASQYFLNGPPVTAAVLVSTKSLGDGKSYPESMIRLKSGALMMAWNEEGDSYTTPDGSLNTGFAYRSATSNWAVDFPVNVPNPYGGNIPRTQMAMAQHPADGSIWSFAKRDSFNNINALHFTETTSGFVVDWINPGYITFTNDGNNGPEGEFPFLVAAADPTRSAILLAYQSHPYQIVFIDPLYNLMNAIFLKESNGTIAQVGADGTKTFIPFPSAIEREVQFGFSVLSDGTIWLTYQPINHTALTWNEVYTTQYSGNVWSAPSLVGFKYMTANSSNGARDPGFVVYRADQPEVAFWTPDKKIHSLVLSNLAPTPPDTTPPATSITSPSSGNTVSGSVTISASASDNVGVTRVELWLDGALASADTASPYSFTWNTTATANGSHALQTKAYDAAGNLGTSSIVTVTVSNSTLANLTVAIISPSNGATVPRNQKVTISASAKDNVPISKVQFSVNGSIIGTATAAPYNCPWKVPGKNNASYRIQAEAYDAMGNTAAQAITVTAQ